MAQVVRSIKVQWKLLGKGVAVCEKEKVKEDVVRGRGFVFLVRALITIKSRDNKRENITSAYIILVL